MQMLFLKQMVFMASYVWSGATLNFDTDLLERRASSAVLLNTTTDSYPTTSIALPPVQLAKPVSQPSCRTLKLGPIPQNLSTTDGQLSPNSLLYHIRQMVCNGSCSAPQGLPLSVVAIVKNSACEISVGVTNGLEGYVYSSFPPAGVEQQECWNSTQAIIEQCVHNQANTGWWNGYVVFNHLTIHLLWELPNYSELTLKQRSCIPILSGRFQTS